MKKILYALTAVSLLIFTGCDDMLDTENYSKTDTSSFPQTQQDAEQIITSCYHALTTLCSNEVEEHSTFVHIVASDDVFGGGSTSNTGAQGIDRLMWDENDGFNDAWDKYYEGVFRTNYALENIPDMPKTAFRSEDERNYLIGQAHFLRAWFNWELANTYETFPLLLSTKTVNEPRTDVETIYKAIADDLTQAINLMPAKYGYSTEAGQSGRATVYAAKAVLARIWMFYTGFYKKNDLAGITKEEIIKHLEDVINPDSKFGLEKDPRVIWPYTNEYSSGFAYGTDFETYVSKNNLHWVGNRSKETVWGVHFSYVWYSSNNAGHNRIGEYFALRNSASAPNNDCYPYGIGYTNGTVNTNLVKDWVTDPDYGTKDKRLWGSIYAVDNAEEIFTAQGWWPAGEKAELESHKGNDSKEVEKTMFHMKKYTVPVCYSDASKSSIFKNFFYAIPGFDGSNSNQYDNRNDIILVRYADVLLMQDELRESVTGMNQLRERAGLEAYQEYSFERLQKERRYELCFEGMRFNDLRRWYPDNAGEIISKNQVGAWIEYRGKEVPGGYKEIPGNGMQKRYAETRGFWRISPTQINLSLNVLTQTPGWDMEDSKVWLFSNGNLPY